MTISTVSYDRVFFVGLQQEQLQHCTWIKAYTLRCTSFSRRKGVSGTTDEDFVLLSLRLLVTAHNPQDSERGSAFYYHSVTPFE